MRLTARFGPVRRDRLGTRYRRSLAGRPAARFVAASGYDRALAPAAQAFVALVPSVMPAAAYLPAGAGGPQERMVDRFDLSGRRRPRSGS